MHYFKRNIGDYHKKAGRLSMIEHGAYTLLIDSCYDRERFPTLQEAYDWTWAQTEDEKEAVLFVLNKFFVLIDNKYTQNRISEEIALYHKNALTNKRIALEREEKRSTNRARTVNEPPPNQEPRTKNQEPLTKETSTTSSLPAENPPKADPIPYQKIVDLYHHKLPTCPRVILLTDKRKQKIAARWKSGLMDSMAEWEKLFDAVSQSKFLTGGADPSNGHKRFVADIEWLANENNIAKVAEGKYL